MRNIEIDPSLFKENRKRFVKLLPPGSLAIFNSNDENPRNGDQDFRFRQNSDLFYLSGINQEQTVLLLFPDSPNEDLQEVLLIREASEKTITWEGRKLMQEDARKISGIGQVKWLGEMDAVLTEFMAYAEHVYLNSNEYPKYHNDVPYRDLRFGKQLRERFPNHDYRRAAPLMHRLRIVKSEPEIELIKKAVEITGKAFRRILKFARPGVKEFEIEAEIQHEFTVNGANGMAYHPIVASGENACFLHYTDNNDECLEGQLLLMDFGAEYANYAADLTRTIPVNGRFSKRQREYYDAVLRVQRAAIRLLVPGNTIDKLNKEVGRMMEREMIELGLLDSKEVSAQDPDKPLYMKYFMHGTSHFIGLDVHDVGSKYKPFRAGMVFTVEPGLYIREEKTGIRLENNVLVTDEGPVDLTAGIPIEPDEIEKLMGMG
jgi:Xaa-Pro aminopeptidase